MPETISASLASWRRKYPQGTTTFKTITVGGKKYQLPSTVKKESTWRNFIKFVNKFNKNPTSANYLSLMGKADDGTQNLVRQYRSFLLGDKLHYGKAFEGTPTAKAFKGLKLNIKPETTKLWKTFDKAAIDLAKQPIATGAAAETALGESAERIRRLNTIFKTNPDISLNGIAAKLNGRAYAMGNNAARLAMATEASNGVALYLTALQKGRKMKNWVPPTGKNKDKIIKNILEGTEGGFRFQEGTLRRYKFNIRDAILKNPQFTSETLRKKLSKIGVIDEAVGLSATYKAAPGYTELVQFIPDKVNRQKGIKLDREFKGLVERSRTGDFTGVKDFNKRSTAFGKKWNIDTPKIKAGGNPTETITYFDKMSDAAKKNVLEIAKGPKGFAIESGALPWGEMGTRIEALKKNKPAFEKFLEVVEKSPAACRRILNYQTGGISATCGAAITKDPVGSANKLAAMEATSGALGKVKNAATTFLGTLGKFGARAAPLAAVAALGAAAEPLVKQFRNDDYSTYLSDPEQQGSMLLAMVEQETPKVDQEILKWQLPAHGAATLAGAVPGAGELYKQRRAVRPQKLPGQPAFVGPMPKDVGAGRAALGIKGVLGKALGASFSPLAVAATLPMGVAAQRSGGTDWSDIATDPSNWFGPAFAASGADFATKGMKSTGILAKAIRMGMSPGALRMGSRFLGLPGLALTGGMWGYDKWKNWGKDKDDEFKVRTYKEDDD
jgi:hypothetical protein